ncbi:MAG: Asp-tRNA(Asn)/Glu-tRNA(Gln) amidotransferase subunit GatC [Patescibacteria group bacterium]|jgi:aspartyl-tRNA(Asn)/glutamyl-tRNA(Gln) amidotransferase subunit C
MDIDIAHVAKLARLKLTEAERKTLAEQLPNIVNYIAKLQEVDTNDVDARAYLTDAVNVWREDVAQENEVQRLAIISAFPKKASEALEVPGVFEK